MNVLGSGTGPTAAKVAMRSIAADQRWRNGPWPTSIVTGMANIHVGSEVARLDPEIVRGGDVRAKARGDGYGDDGGKADA